MQRCEALIETFIGLKNSTCWAGKSFMKPWTFLRKIVY
jgi:hypothetical protein